VSFSVVRVRIAPSPTGNLHVGTARTALFNYLFAKRYGGQFIVRIEDTDTSRSESVYVQNIHDGLKALGLSWDEGPDVGGAFGPYTQSERLDTYRPFAEQLVQQGLAYYDFTPETEIEAMREKATANKQPFIYRVEPLPAQEQQSRLNAGEVASIRFRVPRSRQTVQFSDLVRESVSFDAGLMGDFVILKSDGTPSYNFAVVVDDALMQISHVIRGEDHISNTPKQILLYEALNWAVPQFAHLGMILAPDRSKLSKRHGATAVSDYVASGYLPEAFVNFMALLGWSDPQAEELLSLSQLCERFSLDRVSHSGAIFDVDKLNWMNGHYIREMALPDLWERVRPALASAYDLSVYSQEQQWLMLDVVKEPFITLNDAVPAVSYFFGNSVTVEPSVQQDVLALPESQDVLTYAIEQWLPTVNFTDLALVRTALKGLAPALKPMKAKTVMWAVRAALTGRVQGADLATVVYLLGPDRVAHRLKQAQQVPAA
jgi:nondiscriminating glutamyl-tRNA synthetase